MFSSVNNYPHHVKFTFAAAAATTMSHRFSPAWKKNYHPWDFSRGVGLRCLRIVRFNLKCYSTSSNSTSAHLCRVKLRLMPSLALSWSERRDSSLIVSVYVMTMMTSGPKNAASDPYTMKYELNTYDTEQGTMRKKKTSIGSDWC